MNITSHISTALVLGSLMISPTIAGEGGDGRARLIELPGDPTQGGNLIFSGDGSLSLLLRIGDDWEIYRHEDQAWTLIRREYGPVVPGMFPSGVSKDGSKIVLNDGFHVEVIDGFTTFSMPHDWSYTQDADSAHPRPGYVVGAPVGQGRISGDGRVVTMLGSDQSHDTYSLVWNGGPDLINISDGLPRNDDVWYNEGIPDEDGSVIAFQSGSYTGSGRIWVWRDGERTEIPPLDPQSDGTHGLVAVSGNGEAVIGGDAGPDRGGLSYESLAPPPEVWDRPIDGASTAWIWTERGGTVPIMDSSRFLATRVWDIDHDATVVLGEARERHSDQWRQFLWLRDNRFILVDDLLYTLGISIKADWYWFGDLSDDGTKLMGSATVNGVQQGLIVTIPDLTP